MTKLNIPESSLYMSPLRAMAFSKKYCRITVISSNVVLFAPLLNMGRVQCGKANSTRACRGTSPSVQPRPRPCVTTHYFDRSLNMGVSYGTPHTATIIGKLEMVQRISAEFVMGDYRTTISVTAMMNEHHWQTIQERRAQAKAIIMFRIVNSLVNIPPTHLIPAAVTIRGQPEFLSALCQDLHLPAVLFPKRH